MKVNWTAAARAQLRATSERSLHTPRRNTQLKCSIVSVSDLDRLRDFLIQDALCLMQIMSTSEK